MQRRTSRNPVLGNPSNGSAVGSDRPFPGTYRRLLRGLAIAAVLALTISGGAVATAQPTDVVVVAQGALRGSVEGPVTAFRGVPFGAPPVGESRWQPPQPAAGWTGVRDATAYGPTCMQAVLPDDPAQLEQSEDCLNLNVWKPTSAAPDANLPVMVWIYGGAFSAGSNAQPVYAGTHFAERDVVMVNINYRVGKLGFFAHPALTAEGPERPLGNYGMMDIVAALEWVKANIAAFGGNPDNVTVFGESAGAAATNLLMTMPRSRGLFQKAIAQSGFGRLTYYPIRGADPVNGESLGSQFAESQGIVGSGPEAAQALRDLPAAAFIDQGAQSGQPQALPMIDGQLITENPAAAFAAGRAADVPYILGGNSWESSLLSETTWDLDTYLEAVGPERDAVARAYPGDPSVAAQQLRTDLISTEPIRQLARWHAANGSPTYAYYFSYLPAEQRGSVPGVPHGREIFYTFHNLSDQPSYLHDMVHPPATAADLAISESMINYWTNFAKTGQPGTVNGVSWPQSAPSDTFLEFGPETVHLAPNFRQQQLDAVQNVPDDLRSPVPPPAA